MSETSRLTPAPLPRPLSSFVGRRAEIERLSAILVQTRLLTLAGPPGCGKTRLALEVAATSRNRFPDGVAFVDLAPIRDPAAVLDAAATAIGVPAQSLSELPARIEDARLLLLIDNAEHLIEAVCSLVERLLVDCATLRILVTSREQLNVDGEVRWQVEPLRVPGSNVHDPVLLSAYDSITLFCTRALEHDPTFRLTESNAALVAAICRSLDGIPLALELAAARVPSYGPAEIAARMGDSFSILTQGRRNAVLRHRTIRAAVEWSHDLLDHHEEVLFRRLSLFPASFDLEAAETVCSDGDLPEKLIATTLSRLVGKSLLEVRHTHLGRVRYAQLEVIRQYSRERLVAAGEHHLAARHACYYAVLADKLSVAGGDFRFQVDVIAAEYANVQSTLDWAAGHNAQLLAETTENLQWYWALRGMFREASDRIASALATDDIHQHSMARLFVMAATACRRLGDRAGMRAHLERASALADEIADPLLAVWVANARGLMAAQQGDWTAAHSWFRRLIELVEGMPNSEVDGVVRMHGWPPSRTRSMAMARNNLAMTLLQLGRGLEAVGQAEQALDAAAHVFERSIPLAELFDTCGQAYLAVGRPLEAHDRFIDALGAAVENANDHMAIGPLFGLASSAAAETDYISALTFAAAARRAASSSGTNWAESLNHQLPLILGDERRSRDALSAGVASAAWVRGLDMDIQAALEFAQGRKRSPSHSLLSSREQEVARMVARGLTDKEIAQALAISRRTVEVHLAHVRRKLGMRNRAEVAVWAVAELLAGM